MLNEGFDAASVAFKVGYESASQFSREYARLFDAPSLTGHEKYPKISMSYSLLAAIFLLPHTFQRHTSQ